MVMPDFREDAELGRFIRQVYHEPYSLVWNNCIHKSLKILKKAQEMGREAELVACLSVVPIKALKGFPSIQPHVYVEVDGERVDVSLDPAHEQRYCNNCDKVILLPVKLPLPVKRRRYAGQ